MSTLPKTGERFLYDGLILEAQESEMTCAHCFFRTEELDTCLLKKRAGVLPWCADLDNDKDIIYKYVREATDEEIRRGSLT